MRDGSRENFYQRSIFELWSPAKVQHGGAETGAERLQLHHLATQRGASHANQRANWTALRMLGCF